MKKLAMPSLLDQPMLKDNSNLISQIWGLFESWLIKVVVPADRAAAGPAGNEEGPLRHTPPLLLSSSTAVLIFSTLCMLLSILADYPY